MFKVTNSLKSSRQNNMYLYITLILLTLSSLSYCLLSSPITNANNTDVVDDVNIIVPVSCSLTGTGMDSHTATLPNGIYSGNYNQDGHNYTNGIGSTTLKVFCNDNEGFAIYATGYTGEVIGATNSNKLVSSTNDNVTIDTGTATGPVDNVDESNWAMKLSIVSDSGDTTGTNAVAIDSDTNGSFSSFHAVPNSYTKVAHKNSGTDTDPISGGVALTTTYAAYISKVQALGSYQGKVIYTLVHPASEIPLEPKATEAGCIRYYPNGGSVVGTMGCQSISASDTNATLLASNFSRDSYGFAGWSDVYDYATNENAHFYGPQQYIEFTAGQYTGSNPGLSLYAVWIKSQGNLQDSTKANQVCTNLTQAPTNGTANLDSVSALTDQRDNETYAIAKLADGKCWMIENLRLESTNSDNTTGALAQGYGTSSTYGNFSGLANAENTGFNSTYTANSLYYSGTQEGTASIDIGTDGLPGYRMPRYNNYNHQTSASNRPSNPPDNSAYNNTTQAGMYSYGNYYTWHAAIADLTYNNTNNSSVTTTSLCPSGWRLPKGGNKTRITSNNDNEFWNLVVTGLNGGTLPANYDSQTQPYYTGTAEAGPVANKLRAYPNNFLYSGYFNTAFASGRGSVGYYWSSTVSSRSDSYRLYLYSSYVYPGTDVSMKYRGFSIRCLLSPSA